MRYSNIMVGADPELFLYNTRERRYVSAENIIGGTKNDPRKIGNEGCAVQEDNVLAEFCIPPSRNVDEFVGNVRFMKEYIADHIKKHDEDLVIMCVPSAELDEEFLNTEKAQEFGCEPDFNVWEYNVNKPPNAKANFRSAGGHIHIGYDNPEIDNQERLIKCMDIVVGVSSVLLDGDTRRKELYGKSGAFRFKDYGVEYRTPSNFWVETEDLTALVYMLTKRAVKLANDESFDPDKYKFVQDIINNNDTKKAEEVLDELRILETMDFVHANGIPVN